MNVVADIKNGSHHAFKQAYEAYHERIYFYILGKSGSQYIAEEVLQSAFCKLWQYKETLNEDLPLGVQLFRIANTIFINLLYKTAHEKKALTEYGNRKDGPAVNDTLHQVSHKETEQQIRQVIHAMPPVRRRVFELSRYQGLSYSQIAEELSISIRTVEVHVSKALQQLRRLITLLLLIAAIYFHNH